MKKINSFGIFNIVGLAVGYISLLRLLNTPVSENLSNLVLPAGFPTAKGLIIIWGILFLIWAWGCFYVYSVNLSPRRMRNIFLNSLILIVGIFIWHYILFSTVNLSGTLALSIADLLLSVVVWFMYLVTHRYGGYLFSPVVVWQLYQLYLSISLLVKN